MKWKPSPNFYSREGHKIEAIILHIGEGSLGWADTSLGAINSHFSKPSTQVSAHYGIGYNGEVDQYVKEEDCAWHAGLADRPTWKLFNKINTNKRTIGIEHEGWHDEEWPEAQKVASANLIKDICVRHNIPIDREHIIGHYEIRKSKPNCPALNKSIIDELIKRAKGGPEPKVDRIEELQKVQLSLL